MIVRSFLNWYEAAPMHERVEAVQMMAQCYLTGELGEDGPAEAEAALTLVLDDPATSVRSALAWELALSDRAPRHLIVALAHDRAEAGSFVLARSPQLTDADLIDCARNGDSLAHLAIAMRNTVSARVSAVLANVAGARALSGLMENPGAEIDDETFRIVMRRHGSDAALREVLNARDDLPADVRQSLVTAVAGDLLGMLKERGWTGERRAERCVSESCDAATIEIASEARDLGRYVRHLASSGQLTPSLLIRSLLTGDTSLFGAALVCLGGVSPQRVSGMLRSPGAALSATCVKAGLPRALMPVFSAALVAIARNSAIQDGATTLKRPIIQHVLAACLYEDVEELRPVLAALRRYDAEVARAEARDAVERLKSTRPVVLEAEPEVAAVALEHMTSSEEEIWLAAMQQAAVAGTDDVADVAAAAPVEQEPAGQDAGWQDLPAVPFAATATWDDFETVPQPEVYDSWQAPELVVEPRDRIAEQVTESVRPPVRAVRTAPERLPEDMEKLFADLLRDEPVVAPLRVLDGRDGIYEADYFAKSERRKSAA